MIEQGLGPGVSMDLQDREARSYDFGRMIRRMPGAVATPGSPEEVSGIVRSCARSEVPLTIRGGGHSQGGQSLSDGGMVLDTMRLDRIQPLEGELVRAQAGAQWGKVLDALRGTRLLPPVMADIAEVSVGGTLSAGGLGTTSHRYGMQIVHVEQLEVVTGVGERVPVLAETDKPRAGVPVPPFPPPFPVHSTMVARSPCSVAWTSPHFSPGVSTMRSISPRMASAASARSSGRFSASASRSTLRR